MASASLIRMTCNNRAQRTYIIRRDYKRLRNGLVKLTSDIGSDKRRTHATMHNLEDYWLIPHPVHYHTPTVADPLVH